MHMDPVVLNLEMQGQLGPPVIVGQARKPFFDNLVIRITWHNFSCMIIKTYKNLGDFVLFL